MHTAVLGIGGPSKGPHEAMEMHIDTQTLFSVENLELHEKIHKHLYHRNNTTHGDKYQSQLTPPQQQLLSAKTASYSCNQKLP